MREVRIAHSCPVVAMVMLPEHLPALWRLRRGMRRNCAARRLHPPQPGVTWPGEAPGRLAGFDTFQANVAGDMAAPEWGAAMPDDAAAPGSGWWAARITRSTVAVGWRKAAGP